MIPPGRRQATYRVHWRQASRGGSVVIRWADVADDVRAEILRLTRRALGGELRLEFRGGAGSAPMQIVSDRVAVKAWNPDLTVCPPASPGDWSRSLLRGDPRAAFYRAVQALLRGAEVEGLLDLGQAAAIAEAISLALDGEGPFPVGDLDV